MIYCRKCKHYYVTWDEGFPHGCKAMGFKCKTSPVHVVRKVSEMECQYFVEKKQGAYDNSEP